MRRSTTSSMGSYMFPIPTILPMDSIFVFFFALMFTFNVLFWGLPEGVLSLSGGVLLPLWLINLFILTAYFCRIALILGVIFFLPNVLPLPLLANETVEFVDNFFLVNDFFYGVFNSRLSSFWL